MEYNEQTEKLHNWEVNEEELAELIAAIDRERLNNLLSNSPYLQRHVFPGFRPAHLLRLQWHQVPTKLARDAIGNPAKIGNFIAMWIASNDTLINEVNAIALENVREGVVELLGRLGIKQKYQVLYALRIDDREEIQQALADGLADEIMDETSDLLTQVRSQSLTTSLETAQTEIAKLQNELAEIQSAQEDIKQRLRGKNVQYEEVQDKATKLQAEVALLQAQAERDTHLQEQLKFELQQAQEELKNTRSENTELHQSVIDLRETLQTQAKIEVDKQGETQQQLNETLLLLEDERRKTSQMRLRLDRTDRDLEDAYAKREESQAQYEAIVEKLEKAEHDKEVIIEEKRKLTQSIKELTRDLDDARHQLHEQTARNVIEALPLSELEVRWQEEREAVRDFLRSTVDDTLSASHEFSTPCVDKWGLWSQWLNSETSLVQDVLRNLEQDLNEETVGHIRKAQQLLALRWYVLEYTRQIALARLQESAFLL